MGVRAKAKLPLFYQAKKSSQQYVVQVASTLNTPLFRMASSTTYDRSLLLRPSKCRERLSMAPVHSFMYKELGSTLTGVNYATARRALRKLTLAKDVPELQGMTGDVAETLARYIQSEKNILVEGHQSMGLSNYHGDYPYTTSRDSTAAELLSELGVGPRVALRIIVVIKAFPTRNHNGRLPNEMTITEANALGIKEYGGGSWGIKNNRRRVARIEHQDIKRAVLLNTATELALTGADYLDHKLIRATSSSNLSAEVQSFIRDIENVAEVPVTLVSTGPQTEAMIEIESLPDDITQRISTSPLLGKPVIK
jgi:adenylosuccinate synthase